MKLLDNMSLYYKLVLGLALVQALVMTGTAIFIHHTAQTYLRSRIEQQLQNATRGLENTVRAAVTASVKNYLRAVAEDNLAIISYLSSQTPDTPAGRAQAESRARELLRAQKIGKEGYLYVLSGNGTVRAHPRSELVGTSVAEYGFVQEQMAERSGYLEYEWQNPGEPAPRPKALYMVYYAPWDWIITASAYRSEFTSLVQVEDFQEQILALRFGKSGYSYVTDDSGHFVVHPMIPRGTGYSELAPESVQVFTAMKQQENGQLTYRWSNPGEGKAREKIVIFRYLPELHWFVASTGYFDEVFQPVYVFRRIIFIAAFLTILVTAGVGALWTGAIVRPMRELSTDLATAAGGDFTVRFEGSTQDEVGQLGSYFNNFMKRLEQSRQRLDEQTQERKRAERELSRLAMAVRQADEIILMTDVDGHIVYVNPAFERTTGYTSREVQGQNPRILKTGHHDREFYKQMWETLARGEVWKGRITNRRKDGTHFTEDASISPLRSDTGEIVNYVAVKRDVTEEVRLNQRLRQLQKQEAIGMLAGGIAHDFNNILAALMGYTEVLKGSIGDELGSRTLQEVVWGIKRAGTLVRQILTISKQVVSEKRPIRVAVLVEEAARLLKATVSPYVTVVKKIHAPQAAVFADPTAVHQVIMNLATNGHQAMEPIGGTLSITLDFRQIRPEELEGLPGLQYAGRYVVISVTDSGDGIAPEIMERIFDPFFTTKPKGTGLGLSMVQGVVSDLHGDISVRTERNAGTTIEVLLPAYHEESGTIGKAVNVPE